MIEKYSKKPIEQYWYELDDENNLLFPKKSQSALNSTKSCNNYELGDANKKLFM